MKKNINNLNKILQALPQLQCKKCTYDDCESYARAVLDQTETLDKCEPGAQVTKIHLQNIFKNIDDSNKAEINKYKIAQIEFDNCIGCTICINVCPVDAIVGAKKQQHYIIDDKCNGCELCIQQCPVDCMKMIEHPSNKSWTWPSEQSEASKNDYKNKLDRINENKRSKEYSKEEGNIKHYLKKAIEIESKRQRNANNYDL
tara:strand:- start:1423 stop:2025 length:603 start_codon:yes stop_codon:yes gene_type:complete